MRTSPRIRCLLQDPNKKFWTLAEVLALMRRIQDLERDSARASAESEAMLAAEKSKSERLQQQLQQATTEAAALSREQNKGGSRNGIAAHGVHSANAARQYVRYGVQGAGGGANASVNGRGRAGPEKPLDDVWNNLYKDKVCPAGS